MFSLLRIINLKVQQFGPKNISQLSYADKPGICWLLSFGPPSGRISSAVNAKNYAPKIIDWRSITFCSDGGSHKVLSQLIVWLIKWFIPKREAVPGPGRAGQKAQKSKEKIKNQLQLPHPEVPHSQIQIQTASAAAATSAIDRETLSRCIQIQASARQFICQPRFDSFRPSSIHGQKKKRNRLIRGWRGAMSPKRGWIEHTYSISEYIYLWEGNDVGAACFMPPPASLTRCLFSQLTASGCGWPDTDADTPTQTQICTYLHGCVLFCNRVRVRQRLQLAEGEETKLPPIFMYKCFRPTWCRCQFEPIQNGGSPITGERCFLARGLMIEGATERGPDSRALTTGRLSYISDDVDARAQWY